MEFWSRCCDVLSRKPRPLADGCPSIHAAGSLKEAPHAPHDEKTSPPSFVAPALSLEAQEARGRLLGRVTDQTDAVIAGARVEAANVETGVRLNSVTNRPVSIPKLYSCKTGRFSERPLPATTMLNGLTDAERIIEKRLFSPDRPPSQSQRQQARQSASSASYAFRSLSIRSVFPPTSVRRKSRP